MTCRHQAGDPACSSSTRYVYSEPKTPDSKNYTIEEAVRFGNHLVLKVKYPNCAACAYEGNKVMVFLNVTETQALKWKKIDPHFRGTKNLADEAPSPAARFPASKEGWDDALAYVEFKNRTR